MAPLLKILLPSLVVADLLINVSSVSAFSTLPVPLLSKKKSTSYSSPLSKKNNIMTAPTTPSTNAAAIMRIRGGGPVKASEADPAAKGPPKNKTRIEAFDSLRFFLILIIVLGHFISFANPSQFVFKFVSQHNVAVGAFFALSGYVMAYTTTENGQRAASPKLLETPKQKWILSRIFGYYPFHLAVLALFSPLFVYVDYTYNGVLKTIWNGIMSVTLIQAWFPMSAEVWNAPTWYLSALNFVTACMPFALPSIAKMDKKQLRKTTLWVFMAYILPKLGYLYDFDAWSIAEGVTSPKTHPNLAVFNMQRFSPVFAVAEVLLGALACRLVMLDDAPDEKDIKAPKTNVLSTFVPLATIVGGMYARAAGIGPPVSDFIFRCLIFVPFFLRFLMSAHRNVVNNVSDPVTSALSNKFLVWLGGLSFPIFIIHGPVGQIFFKKLVANKLWGTVLKGPVNFGMYLATLVAVAYALQKLFLQNKAVGNWSKKQVDNLSGWF